MSRYIIFTFLALSCLSCMDDNFDTVEYSASPVGLFIANSGNYGSGTSSLSYLDFSSESINNDVITNANDLHYWGDVAQSMAIVDSFGYVVVNNSSMVLIINTNTMKVVGKILDLDSPRYMHVVNKTKAYITSLYGRTIHVVDPSSFLDSQTLESWPYANIDVANSNADFDQHSTERMVQWGPYVFVACWMRDDQILVVDSDNDLVVDSITVGAQPNSLVIDKYNRLWVLCDGGYNGNPYAYETPKLFRIDLNTYEKEDSIIFDLDDNPSNLVINSGGDSLFFIDGDIYYHSVLSSSSPEVYIHGSDEYAGYGKGFYTLGIDPNNSDIYVADALDNVQPGVLYHFDNAGAPQDTFKVGINPTGFCFK